MDEVTVAPTGEPSERAIAEAGPNRSDVEALKDGAAMMIQAGNRVAALALLWSAVAIDPTDLTAHRRLAATLAHGGDIDGAAEEYARYIEFMLPLGEIGRATMELNYGAKLLGGHPALHDAAEKIVTAVRAIVPAHTLGAPVAEPIAPRGGTTTEPIAITAPPPAAIAAPQPLEVAPEPLPAPRLLPKVALRYCVHEDGDDRWMQLEGGTREVAPIAVRLVDRNDNVIESRSCIPLAPGEKGHARIPDAATPSVAWTVLPISLEVATALEHGAPLRYRYRFQAKVGDDWLSTELVDTGCRYGRARGSSAAS